LPGYFNTSGSKWIDGAKKGKGHAEKIIRTGLELIKYYNEKVRGVIEWIP
jgi:hypothetical protein